MIVNPFSDDYEPRIIVRREEEQKAIADYLKDCSRARTDKIFYIHGIAGIGKTTVTKAVLKQFEENCDEAVVVYHDCRNSSCYKCLRELHSKCFGLEHKRLTSEQIVRAFTKKVWKKLVLICVLDNFDKLRDLENFVSDFHKIRRNAPKSGLVLISTSGNKLIRLLGNRLYSMLRFDVLEFEPYSLNELVEIMGSRIEETFGRKIAEDLALFEIASFVRNNSQNVRHAFQILENAMEIAQENSLRKVTPQIARTAVEKWLSFNKVLA
jgi:Cdc6-like AAA superfamily ATPase